MRRIVALATAFAAVSSLCLPAGAEVPSAVAPGHVVEPQGLYHGAMQGYTPLHVTGGTVLDTSALANLIDTQHPLLLDVAEKERKPPTMSKEMIWLPTHRSIAGAVYLQGGGSGTDDKTYADDFKTRVTGLTDGDLAKPVVTFCHPDCWGSYNAAKRLVGLGYTKVFWYRDGVEGWQAAHETRVVRPDRAWIEALPKDATQ